MSKIGRKPIKLNNVEIDIQDNIVHYKGKKSSGAYTLPTMLNASLNDSQLLIMCNDKSRDANRVWGLHRALLANEIIGASDGFTQKITITGLGFKAIISGDRIDFSLGYSHKIPFILPEGIKVETDKTGQLLTVQGISKELVGKVCSKIRAFRKPEPYKGTGIKVGNEVIVRKAGKTKSS